MIIISYLEDLLKQSQFVKAAEECRRLVGDNDVSLWEKCIALYKNMGQLPLIASFIPTLRLGIKKSTYLVCKTSQLQPNNSR